MFLSTAQIIIIVISCISVFIIQAFLSSRTAHYIGFILPFLTFVFCLYVMWHFKELIGDHGFVGYEVWGWYALQFFIGNIPTVILLLIHSIFKPKYEDQEEDPQEEYFSFDHKDE